MNKKTALWLLLLWLVPAVLHAQEEEVILSSANIEEAERANTAVKVKKRYHYIDSTAQSTLFLIALRPDANKFPATYDFTGTKAFGLSLVLSYERLLKNRQFSVFIENATRLHAIDDSGYDYDNKFRFRDSRGNNLNRGGEFDANISTFDIGAKFYYRQKQRVEYGVSGVNPYNDYVFLRIKDAFSYVRRTTIRRTESFGFTELHTQQRRLLLSPGYIQAGWGTQKRLLDRFMVDFHIGLGFKVLGKRNHASRDVMFDVGINLGLGLGKRN